MTNYLLITIILLLSTVAFGEKWSFGYYADNLTSEKPVRWACKELTNATVNTSPAFPKAEFIVAGGDLSLASSVGDSLLYDVVRANSNGVAYFPVNGNHDVESGCSAVSGVTCVEYMVDSILVKQDSTTVFSDGLNYYVDWKNVRLIVLDQYTAFWGETGWIDSVSSMIAGAGNNKHVFIAFHCPAFARQRHTSIEGRGSWVPDFWNMLISHGNKVKGVLVGHTHWYDILRIKDPDGPCATDTGCYETAERTDIRAHEDDGIWQIDPGHVGIAMNDPRMGIVWIQVDDDSVTFMVKKGLWNWEADDPDWQIANLWTVNDAPDREAPYFTVFSPGLSMIDTVRSLDAVITVNTNENSTVKWSYTNQEYGSMANTFSITGDVLHSTVITCLQGETKTLYIRAADDEPTPNIMDTSAVITFLADTNDYYDPRFVSAGPRGVIHACPAELMAATNENATVKWDLEDRSYAEMENMFTITGGVVHTANVDCQYSTTKTVYLRAKDDSGNESAPEIITFVYDTSISGPQWKNPGYTTTGPGWSAGLARFGNYSSNTPLASGINAAYFVKLFNIPDVSEVTRLQLYQNLHYGSVAYLNGREVLRAEMSEGPVTYDTWAADTAGWLFLNADISEYSDLLINGTNTLAIEVHKKPANNTFFTFAARLAINNSDLFGLESEWSYHDEGCMPPDLVTEAYTSNGFLSDIGVDVSPNPFNPSTTISIKNMGFIMQNPNGKNATPRFDVFDVKGRRVASIASVTAAIKSSLTAVWDASDMPAGIYVLKVHCNGKVMMSKKLILLN
ncbi:MAG: hypothetical protein A2268_07430 [Candidatus Raymondbacteria bacterium RifOxyA12_full_50_37]|uniref:Cadherin domain-containing protein n=1 Tax=Candidatus Raymondbacteria bacterium RIFOXYD12_FULL_49_13 TaxID=1817890 RepID=A0A1F7F664_UNCRA|nr:MAG: hypothetical protein A2350_09195 [Candidatus Raymondbacteria bacterium RifOxyB12_full_50_8]OGJ89805.1 MAG: hypothetical protein A2268_07430 [Candidatus Raymondbacteria bacterium RifOxyA12_full_50_37]OGJ91213.1 MAG: hypothetical protein A2248_01575 [Candidatus Raymondbacteria bacterium RIFOXYA2_FULL_49_16]OGJ96151.1 MAG: hypothetical protein A2487_01540 [Candidatus Raymondbacteria bacterium RifOxyC12_full_50_8]OGJ97611.1 MAG: hypothetical protein A2453_02340 [Candidatus Raymondbacteria b